MIFGRTCRAAAFGTTMVFLMAGMAAAAPSDKPAKPPEPAKSSERGYREVTGDIVTQPVRDVGITKADIPPVLVKATADPYSLAGLRTCRQLATAVAELSAELGPDFQRGGTKRKENKAAKLAQAGGKTVVNSILPFRTLVREVSGAASADRRFEEAVTAGYARRGFLRGVHATRKCRPAL